MSSHKSVLTAILILAAGLTTHRASAQQTPPLRVFEDDGQFASQPVFDVPPLIEPEGRVSLGADSVGVPPAPGTVGHSEPRIPPDATGGLADATGGLLSPSIGYDNPIPTNQLFAEPLQFDKSLPQPKPPTRWKVFESVPDFIEWPHKPLTKFFGTIVGGEHVDPHTELHGHPIGIRPIPERPPLVIEENEPFLGPGWLKQGIELPTGVIVRPALWVFGTYRTGVQHLETPTGTRVAEWAHRLNLFGQLNFTGTERILLGLRPLDQEVGRGREFNGYGFRGGDWIDGWNGEIQTLFFEGDFGEIFPRLDPLDSEQLDYGFSVGRMPLLAQQGLFINEDKIDALTITRNTLYAPGLLNLRMTGVYAWDEVNRNNNVADDDAQLFAFLTESDFKFSTVNADVAYVKSAARNGDMIAYGISGIQRLQGFHNIYNSSVHFLASHPIHGESPLAGQGELLFSQFSWTPHHSFDLIYFNAFWAIDQFTSPARGTLAGGPLGQTGILFSAPGLGRIGAPLSNQASNTAGASIGYQIFFDETRKQIVFEIGGRGDTNKRGLGDMGAAGVRYQQAFGQHWVMIVDGILSKREGAGLITAARLEMLLKF